MTGLGQATRRVLVALAVAASACASPGGGDPGSPGSPGDAPRSPLEVVEAQMAAFDRHDVDAMAALVAPDFVWRSVDGAEVTVEVRGRDALAEGMRSYFASLPDVRSGIESVTVAGAFVAVRERATWTDRDGVERSATSLGVYEVRDGLIRRVWYYPAGG